ncbi:MAG: LysM peptidoglycan-binding domain-containing protein [Chloroflexi bacterium]|nr:LysM peptidoglycan-binding domain-containing protein [Chloroflexota bacterium]
MKRLFPFLIIASIILTSCGQSSSLWGTYSTPTPEIIYPSPFTPDPPTATDTATLPPLPTSTFTLTPTKIAPTSSTPQTPSNKTPGLEATLTPKSDVPSILYYSQSGDTLPALAARFNVNPSEIQSDASLPEQAMIPSGTLLVIPDRITEKTTPNIQIIPDSELVFSATAIDFNIPAYIKQSGGYLSKYREYLGSTGWTTGDDIIKRIAYENSINPRLLLAVLDYESRWVRGQPVDSFRTDYPMGYQNQIYKGMFSQMVWAVDQLSYGYYGWRTGQVTELTFTDGIKLRLDPRLNAGTVAIQYLFSRLRSQSQWSQMIDPNSGFPAVYIQMFGDPWARAEQVGSIFPADLKQPPLVLPFEPNRQWNLTGGPHGAWDTNGPLAALDLAPTTSKGGCDVSEKWLVASAPGLVVRSAPGVLIIDLDGDGYEQTGWDLVYLHIGTKDRAPVGKWVQTDERVGHASCEGGITTGTHVHLVRKYNGEWITADGPIPFNLSGWIARAGQKPYEGGLVKGDTIIPAEPFGSSKSLIVRTPNE